MCIHCGHPTSTPLLPDAPESLLVPLDPDWVSPTVGRVPDGGVAPGGDRVPGTLREAATQHLTVHPYPSRPLSGALNWPFGGGA